MMTACAFMGDEVSATGFRLAGIDVHVPAPGNAAGLLRRLLAESQLVLLTAETAALVPEELLRRAQTKAAPPVLVIPDVRGRVEPPDLASLLRCQLGMAE